MAVYTDVSDADLALFVRDYDIGRVTSSKGIAEGVENSNFFVQTTAGGYILTLYEKRVAVGDLPFFLGLMEHLAARGLNCPTPLKTTDGVALRELNGRPAAMVSFLPGLSPRRIEMFHCAELGQTLARLHEAGRDFPIRRTNGLSLDAWRPLAAASGAGADSVAPGLGEVITRELDALEAHWPRDLPVGVIHADLFPDNAFFLDDRMSGIIDFYFACNDMLAYDLAVCLNAWCFDPDGGFAIERSRAMFEHYQAVRRLDPAEIAALPWLARGAALRFLLTRLYDWLNVPPGALVRPKDPLEYLARLRFHQAVDSAADYGVA